MKRKIGINANCLPGISVAETMRKLKELGCYSFFTESSDEQIPEYKRLADELGLVYEFVHGPWRGMNAFWQEGDEYLELDAKIKKCIDYTAKAGVPAVIVHVSSGWFPPAVNELGLSRFDSVVKYANDRGVIVAFENLRVAENLMILAERYKDNELVRFCYDSGHAHGYTPEFDFISAFGKKLYCTHIHDNLGFAGKDNDPDAHFLPFDGTLDYADMVRRLDEVGYEGTLMLEIFKSRKPEYMALTDDEFLKTAFERAEKIVDMGRG